MVLLMLKLLRESLWGKRLLSKAWMRGLLSRNQVDSMRMEGCIINSLCAKVQHPLVRRSRGRMSGLNGPVWRRLVVDNIGRRGVGMRMRERRRPFI